MQIISFLYFLLNSLEEKRIAFLLSIFKNNDILILDEPTASLNKEYSKVYCEIFKSLCALGKSIIVFTHDSIVTEVADIRYNIENKYLKLISGNSNDESGLFHNPQNNNLNRMIQYFFKMRKNYTRWAKIINVVLLVLIATVGFEISMYDTIKNTQKSIIENMNSNELIVYKASDHAVFDNIVEYTFGHEKPISNEDMKKIKSIDKVESVEWRYDSSEPNYQFNDDITKVKFDPDNAKNDYTINFKQENDVIDSIDIDNTVTVSTYLKSKNYNNNIDIQINDEGVYISRFLANSFKEKLNIEKDQELKNIKLQFDIAVPVYNTYGRWQGVTDDEETIYIYSTTITHHSVELPIAGILKWSTMGIDNGFENAIYVERDIVANLIDQYKEENDRKLYVMDDAYSQWYVDQCPDEAKENVVRVFEDTPWKPTALSVYVDGVENIFSVSKELMDLGFTVDSEYINNNALTGGIMSMKNLFMYSALVLNFVIVMSSIGINMTKRKEEKNVNKYLKQLGLNTEEISHVRKKFYAHYTAKAVMITLIIFALFYAIRVSGAQSFEFPAIISILDVIILNFVCFYIIPVSNLGKYNDSIK